MADSGYRGRRGAYGSLSTRDRHQQQLLEEDINRQRRESEYASMEAQTKAKAEKAILPIPHAEWIATMSDEEFSNSEPIIIISAKKHLKLLEQVKRAKKQGYEISDKPISGPSDVFTIMMELIEKI